MFPNVLFCLINSPQHKHIQCLMIKKEKSSKYPHLRSSNPWMFSIIAWLNDLNDKYMRKIAVQQSCNSWLVDSWSYLSTVHPCSAGSWSHHTRTAFPRLFQSRCCGTHTVRTHSLHGHCRWQIEVLQSRKVRCSGPAPWGYSHPLHIRSEALSGLGGTGRCHTRRCHCLGCIWGYWAGLWTGTCSHTRRWRWWRGSPWSPRV